MTSTWTSEQIAALAPDASSAKAGRGLATPRKWRLLGYDERAAWGECQGSAKDPYRTQVDLQDTAFRCTCPSRKLPCKHGLGLLFLLESQPAAFETNDPAPAWVSDWLAGRVRRAEQKVRRAEQSATESVDPQAQARRQSEREAKVQAGLAELELWLHDLVRNGLATVQTRPLNYWNNPAARLVDAQAPGLARLVRELGTIPASGPGWQERLLERIGRLHLLIEGYKRLDTLPVTQQAGMRSLVGWTLDQDKLLAEAGERDHWLVLGQQAMEEERLKVQRTWLLGQKSGKAALVLNFAPLHQSLDTSLVPGTNLEAELVFYPDAYPLRAIIKERAGLTNFSGEVAGACDISTTIGTYATALALNPWLEEFPVALRAVIPVQREETWLVVDGEGYALPLAPRFTAGWKLVALSGGRPLGLFGEWDGDYLWPLSVWVEGRFIPLPTRS